MGSRVRVRLASLAALTITLAAVPGWGASAQSPSPSLSAPSPVPSASTPAESLAPDLACRLLTVDEVVTALGFAVVATPATATECLWLSTEPAASLRVSVASTTLADVKAAEPGGTDLAIGDAPAYALPNALWLEVGDSVLGLRVDLPVGTTDPVVTLDALAALAAGRLKAMSMPDGPASSLAPSPSAPPDAGIADLFPRDLRGPFDEPLTVTVVIGEDDLREFIGTAPGAAKTLAQLLAALAAQGGTIDDLSIGYATLSDVATGLLAVRARGVDAAALQPDAVRLIVASVLNTPGGLVTFGKPQQSKTTIDGKDVLRLTPAKKSRSAGQAYAYVYAHDDVVWFVTGFGDGRDRVPKEALQALP